MPPTTTHSPQPFGLATYLSEINQTPLLSALEEKELAQRIQEGDTAARDQLIRANLRLVVHIARSLHCHGVSLEDLIEEGNLGLIRAVEAFDVTRKTRFSTYAAYWIKQSMAHCLGAARALALPSYVVQMLREWRRASSGLEEELNRQPTDEEIAKRLKLPPRKVRLVKKALKVLASKRTGSDGSAPSLGATLAISSSDHENRVATRELLEKAVHLLEDLDRREAGVLRMRFGLQGAEPLTLAEIGKRLHLTRERVRQIETEAILHLHDKMEPAPGREERRGIEKAASD